MARVEIGTSRRPADGIAAVYGSGCRDDIDWPLAHMLLCLSCAGEIGVIAICAVNVAARGNCLVRQQLLAIERMAGDEWRPHKC